MRMVVSSDALATSAPSGDQTTSLTPRACPASAARGAPVAPSQSLTARSAEADASSAPEGEKRTAVTDSACAAGATARAV